MGAVCNDCEKDMMEADGCTHTQMRDPRNKKCIKRKTDHFDEPDGRCHDCNAKHGEVHHYGCDAERCPVCGGQLISCECFRDNKMRNKITLRK